MATLTAIAVSPSTIARGSKAAVTPTISNPDRVQKITGVDETGANVTATYNVHENLTLLVGQSNVVGGKAPAGTIVFWTDSTTDVLTVDATNPLTLDLQTN